MDSRSASGGVQLPRIDRCRGYEPYPSAYQALWYKYHFLNLHGHDDQRGDQRHGNNNPRWFYSSFPVVAAGGYYRPCSRGSSRPLHHCRWRFFYLVRRRQSFAWTKKSRIEVENTGNDETALDDLAGECLIRRTARPYQNSLESLQPKHHVH